MPLLWLKVAVGFYAIGLLWATAAVSRPCNFLSKVVLPALGLGMVFHFVSLAESAMTTGHLTLTLVSIHESESLLAFVILAFFLLVDCPQHRSGFRRRGGVLARGSFRRH